VADLVYLDISNSIDRDTEQYCRNWKCRVLAQHGKLTFSICQGCDWVLRIS